MTDQTRFASTNPATGETLWEGASASPAEVAAAIEAAQRAFAGWATTRSKTRIAHVRAYKAALETHADEIARAIARETGKPFWEGGQEVASMTAKVDISIEAQAERAGTREQETAFGRAVLRHRPHGVMAVLGPYNFPGHLPNGHIVPALLAGNTVVFKPSEETPLVGAADGAMLGRGRRARRRVHPGAGRPRDRRGAGRRRNRRAAVHRLGRRRARISAALFADRPEVILALELGGNNPLIVWDGDAARRSPRSSCSRPSSPPASAAPARGG